MSCILYDYFLKKLNFKLNKIAFMYGNIKPDFCGKDIECPHILSDSIYKLEEYSNILINSNLSNKDFSVSLGIICHFICDYFCLYHGEKYKNKNIFSHNLYEIILHIKFLILFIRGKLKINYNGELIGESIIFIVLNSYKKYSLETNSGIKDINYAISIAALVGESIISLSNVEAIHL